MNREEKKIEASKPSLVTTAGPGEIPRGHEPLSEASVSDFSSWLDQQLEQLERRYQHNWTAQAVKVSLGR